MLLSGTIFASTVCVFVAIVALFHYSTLQVYMCYGYTSVLFLSLLESNSFANVCLQYSDARLKLRLERHCILYQFKPCASFLDSPYFLKLFCAINNLWPDAISDANAAHTLVHALYFKLNCRHL